MPMPCLATISACSALRVNSATSIAKLKDATISRAALIAYDRPTLSALAFEPMARSVPSAAMLNALVDFGPHDGVNFSVGAGVGGAQVSYRAGLFRTAR